MPIRLPITVTVDLEFLITVERHQVDFLLFVFALVAMLTRHLHLPYTLGRGGSFHPLAGVQRELPVVTMLATADPRVCVTFVPIAQIGDATSLFCAEQYICVLL